MDEHTALIISTLVGGGVASFGAVCVIGWKVWQAVAKLLPSVGRVASTVDEALGSEDNLDVSGLDTPEPRRRRRTGAFQQMIREELEEHDRRLDRRFDRLEATVDGLAEGFEGMRRGQKKHADLLAGLASATETVQARTAEHSAELALARADGSMTAGRVTQLDRGPM